MRTDRGKAFEQYEPAFDQSEIKAALAADRIALSLTGATVLHPSGAIQFLAVKFALADGNSTVLLIDRVAAAALRTLIESADKLNWDANSLRPGPTSH